MITKSGEPPRKPGGSANQTAWEMVFAVNGEWHMKRLKKLKKTLRTYHGCCNSGRFTAFAIGEEIRHASTSIGTGTRLARGVFIHITCRRKTTWSTPKQGCDPCCCIRIKVCNYGDFKSMAALLEKGDIMSSGINGDYYELKSYQPVSLVITDGILRSSDGQNWAIGFREDGTAPRQA